ncbi:MAG: thermonuclease family protein [candidate division Zixibacteria bacterium]|nr:thermonuclease family protein [candidate division Zixibacteria bacterium]
MADKIRGLVTDVVDGDTFDVKVTWRSPDNANEYDDTERIRINKIDAPELTDPGGPGAKETLEDAIDGKVVDLTVYSRDKYGRLVCDVSVV